MIIRMTTLSPTLKSLSERAILLDFAVNRAWNVTPTAGSTDGRSVTLTRTSTSRVNSRDTVTVTLEFVGSNEDELNYVEVWTRNVALRSTTARHIASVSMPDEGKLCIVTALAVLGGQL